MSFKKTLLFFTLFITVTSYAQLPTAGLSAWYPFCGNVLDRSGNALDLTLSGPTNTSDRFGFSNSAYSFNGNTTALTSLISRTPPMTDTGDFTYAAWFNADTTGNRIILANGNINVDGCGIVTTGHNVAVAIGGVATYLPTYINFHQWHHAVLRKSGVTYSFYLDTTIIGAFTTALIPAPSGQKFAVGQDYTSGAKAFLGKIDDIAIYNRALTNVEIGNLYRYNPDVQTILGNNAAVCAGFSATLTPVIQYPGLSYLWSNGSTDTSIVADTMGSYWLNITRPYGCSSTDTITFTLGTVTVNIGRDTAVCTGDTFVLVPYAPAGSTYLWSTGDTTATLALTAPGTYSLLVNNFGCPGHDTMNFFYSPRPFVSLGPDISICSVSPLTLSSSYAYTAATYHWNTGAITSTIHPTTSGLYILRVLVAGCPASDTINVTIKPSPVVSFGPDRSLCQGDSIVLSAVASPTAVYTWSTGELNDTITAKNTGTFWLVVNDNGCIATDTFNLTVNPYPLIHLGPDISVCQGTPVVLKSTDVYVSPTYLWSTGATTAAINVTTSGSYTLSVTKFGCTSKDDINVTIKPNPIVNLGPDGYFCAGQTISLAAPQPAGANYIWSTGSTASSISVSTSGLYGLVVTNNGCVGSDSIRLDKIQVPAVNLGPDTLLCEGYAMQLAIDGDQATYRWSDGSTGTGYTVSHAGTVWVSITNVCGVATDTLQVAYRFCDIWMPNAFTPNGDGRNDVMRVLGTLGSYSDFKFAVFNRWGVNVFLTEDISKGWDGNYNNMEQAIGTYFYIMSCKLNGVEYNMKGSFELIR